MILRLIILVTKRGETGCATNVKADSMCREQAPILFFSLALLFVQEGRQEEGQQAEAQGQKERRKGRQKGR